MKVPAELRKTIEERAKELNWTLMEVAMEEGRGDTACAFTVIRRENSFTDTGYDFATHIFYPATSGFALGRYDFKDFESALKDMKSRL